MAMQKSPAIKSVQTRAVHSGEHRVKPHHTLTTPIYQTSTYTFESTQHLSDYMEAKIWGDSLDRVEYGRYGNPTITTVQRKLADLDGAEAALLFSSGMAAITSTLLTLLSSGSHIIMTDDCYRRSGIFVTQFLKRYGVEATQVPMGNYEALEAAIQPNTKVILSESPTNPYLRILDIPRVVEIAQRHKIKTVIDSTFATPINQRPIEMGIDFVVHSATKYLGGHNDLLAGVVTGSEYLLATLKDAQGMLGDVLDPHTAYLLLRGLKTLGLRVKHHNASSMTVAQFLEDHPCVDQVYYPGLPSHPDYEVANAQMTGFGGVVSFTLKTDFEHTMAFIDQLEIPYIGPSLGGPESLIEPVAVMSYFELSTEERQAIGIDDTLIRLSIGLEDTDDLIADLGQAFNAIFDEAAVSMENMPLVSA